MKLTESQMAQMLAAAARARRLYPLSAGFQGAYKKGARARVAGNLASTCPYKGTGGWTAWRRAWLRGFQSVAADE